MARKYKRLRYEDRQVIEKMSRAGSRVVDIAATLGVHRDTIYKEYARCGATADTYSAEVSELQKGNEPQVVIQQVPQAGEQNPQPEAGETQDGQTEKEGVNNAS